MTPEQWEKIDSFDTTELWGNPYKMDHELLLALDALRKYIDRPIIIHCGYEKRKNKTSQHNFGRAVDLYIAGISLWDQFMVAQCFSSFRGIGVYPWWHSPGLHLDTRILDKYTACHTWGSTSPGKYIKLTKQFMLGQI